MIKPFQILPRFKNISNKTLSESWIHRYFKYSINTNVVEFIKIEVPGCAKPLINF